MYQEKNISMELNVSRNHSTEDTEQIIQLITTSHIMYKIGKI